MKLLANRPWSAALLLLAGSVATPVCAASEPGAPTLNSVTRAADGSLRVNLQWTPPSNVEPSIFSYSFYGVDSKGRYGVEVYKKDAASPMSLPLRACGERTVFTINADSAPQRPPSNSIAFTAYGGVCPPEDTVLTAAPVVTVIDPNSTSPRISWTVPAGNVRGYTVRSLDQGAFVPWYSLKDTAFTLYCWQTVRVVATNDKGPGPESNTILATCAKPAPPTVASTPVAWTQIGVGMTFTSVSIGSASNAWGTNAGGQIQRWNGAGWTQMQGVAVSAAMGADGTVWVVNSADTVFRWNGVSWNEVPGAPRRVSVGTATNVWGVTAGGQIQKWTGTGWTQMPGAAVSAAVGADGAVWVLNSADEIYRWNGSGWNRMPGALRWISVGNATNVWGVNAGGSVYKFNNSTGGWDQPAVPSGTFIGVSTAADGSTLLLRNDGTLWKK